MIELRAYPPLDGFLGIDDSRAVIDQAGVVVLPVPFEQTSSFGHGSANGPETIRLASHQVEVRDADLGFAPFDRVGGIATALPLPLDRSDTGATVADKLDAAVTQCLNGGKMAVTIGGEHTSIVGAVRAYARCTANLTVLQLDAHSDMRPSYHDSPWNHACAMARILDFHDGSIVQVGIRSEADEDLVFLEGRDIPVFYGEHIQRDAANCVEWIEPIINACTENVYITLDCDVFDPSVIPATGTPEPGGLTWLQMNELLKRLCQSRRVVGFDVSELSPIQGLHFPEFTVAKLLYRLIGLIGDSK